MDNTFLYFVIFCYLKNILFFNNLKPLNYRYYPKLLKISFLSFSLSRKYLKERHQNFRILLETNDHSERVNNCD